MLKAVENACGYVEVGIRTAPNFGKGSGPINHFHGSLIVEKPKGSKDQQEPKKSKSLLQSTLTTEIWNGGGIDVPRADGNETLTGKDHGKADKAHDQVLEARKDSPQIGDRFVRTPPPPAISEELKLALKEVEEKDKEDDKREKAERAAKKRAAAAKRQAVTEEKAAKKAADEAAKKAADEAARNAEEEDEEDGEEVQQLVAKPRRRPTKAVAEKPSRLTLKDQTIKRATAAPKGFTKEFVRRTMKPAEQQTATDAGEQEDVLEASKDASKKVGAIPKNRQFRAPIALPTTFGYKMGKAIQRKPAPKAGEMRNGGGGNNDVTGLVEGTGLTKQQLERLSFAPAPKPAKRRLETTEGNLDTDEEYAAGPSQAPAPKPSQRLKLTCKGRDPKEAGDKVDVVDVDEHTKSKNEAMLKMYEEASAEEVRRQHRKRLKSKGTSDDES